MPESDQPSRPGRIIIPGSESTESDRPRIIVPGDDSESEHESSASGPAPSPRHETDLEDEPGSAGSAHGIILPPGASELPRDVPEYPRLRPLVLMPISDGQREMVLVSDPLGVVSGQPVLSMDTLPLLQLFDGTLSLNDITTAVMRESKDLRVSTMIRDFVAQLDELLLLDSPRFHRALQALRDAYHPLEIRPTALEGRSYPAEPAALRSFLAGHFEQAEKLRQDAGEPVAPSDARPRALLVPHLDPRRAGAVIARAYLELGPEPKEPLRVVVFGTGHSLLGELVALTRKHFETPLGKVTCDTRFVDHVAARFGDDAYRGELAHREEHSIEFQALYLKYRLGDRPFTIVPILCGGFHTLLDEGITPRQEPMFETLIEAVRDAERTLGGATMYVGGVDFSHVGTRFGDPAVDDRVKRETEDKDRKALDAALHGDADAWFTAIAEHDDSSRICGFAPTYALLRCADVREGRLLRYEQSEEEGSVVSVAAVTWSS